MLRSVLPIDRLVPCLLRGDVQAFVALFATGTDGADLSVDDPVFGRATGPEGLENFARTMHAWLSDRRAVSKSVRETYARTEDGVPRGVLEFELSLDVGGRPVDLPVAMAVDGFADRPGLGQARIYHSTWPLSGSHRVRPPLLAADPKLVPPDVLGRYQAALAKGDAEGLLKTFAPTGYARQPSGAAYVSRGLHELQRFYTGLLAGGGVGLAYCRLLDDGTAYALEYNVTRLGDRALPPQAGLAVYERNAQGLLVAARIYDDLAI